MSRFPFPTTPTGWYQVAHSEDVAPGQVVPLRYFGRDLVCARTASGTALVLDAFCPHLGAHLGYGGCVEGEELVCPFHGWRFDTEGHNVAIPYSGRPNRRARLSLLPVAEANGIVFAWHGPEGEPPSFEPPVLPEASDERFVRVRGERFRLRTHVQEVMENTVDAAHFEFVHKTHGFGTPTVVEEGPMLRSSAPVVFVTPRGDVHGEVVSELWGLGIDVVRPRGITEAAVIFGVTPVDDEVVEAGYTFYVTKGPDGGPSRVAQGLIRDFDKQVTQDAPIWEHKCYRPKPALAAEERAITSFRRWAAQFHGAAATGGRGRKSAAAGSAGAGGSG